jgi:hypothetical protein
MPREIWVQEFWVQEWVDGRSHPLRLSTKEGVISTQPVWCRASRATTLLSRFSLREAQAETAVLS